MDYSPLGDRLGPALRFGVPAAVFTTYRAGGPAEALAEPATVHDLAWAARWCAAGGVPFRVLGRGSNVLVSDAGLPGVTILTGRLGDLAFDGPYARAQCGVAWDDLALRSSWLGLAGLEKTSGIPGSVGGAVRMNAGAFGQETFDRLVEVEVLAPGGASEKLPKQSLPHGYRHVSGLEGKIVLSALFKLEPGDSAALRRERDRVLAARAEKQPLDLPSAGSVFKRPPGDYASRLIDAAGLKGRRVGGAEVSAKHAGFIVNRGGATAGDIHELISVVRAEVRARTGVLLEPEQLFLGEFPDHDAPPKQA